MSWGEEERLILPHHMRRDGEDGGVDEDDEVTEEGVVLEGVADEVALSSACGEGDCCCRW